jgi:hypothetical protein
VLFGANTAGQSLSVLIRRCFCYFWIVCGLWLLMPFCCSEFRNCWWCCVLCPYSAYSCLF